VNRAAVPSSKPLREIGSHIHGLAGLSFGAIGIAFPVSRSPVPTSAWRPYRLPTPMSLFRDLGRRAERFKQQVVAAADTTHECADCGEALAGDLETCPECGSEDVVPID